MNFLTSGHHGFALIDNSFFLKSAHINGHILRLHSLHMDLSFLVIEATRSVKDISDEQEEKQMK